MIDDYHQAMALVSKMKANRPIPVRPTKAYVRALEEQGKKIKRNQRLQIDQIFYGGEEGGILCGLVGFSENAEEAHVVSLTHLEVERHHPLAREIRAYQRKRIRRLAESGQSNSSSTTIYPRRKE